MLDAPGPLARRALPASEAADPEGLERRGGAAVNDELGDDLADDGSELEAMPREAEGVDEVRRRRGVADHRDVVRHLAVDAGPGADHMCPLEGRDEIEGPRHSAEGLRRSGAREGQLRVAPAAATAEDDVAAGDLAYIDVAAADADRAADEEGDRLAQEHVRRERGQRDEFAEEGSDWAGADPGAVDEEAARHDEIFGAGLETGRGPLGGDHRRALAHVGTEPSREPRISRPDEARVRLPVLGRERGSDHR